MVAVAAVAIAPWAATEAGAQAPPPSWTPCGAGAANSGASRSGAALDGSALDAFGSLAAAPSLTIDVPSNPAAVAGAGSDAPFVDVERVAGGVLVSVKNPVGPGFGLSVVDDDGTVRWAACSDRVLWTVATAPGAAGAVVVTADWNPVGDEPSRIERWSVDDGSVLADLTAAVAAIGGGLSVKAETPQSVFFGAGFGTILDADSRLARVDLASGEVAERGVPSGTEGLDAGTIAFSTTRSGFLTARFRPAVPVDAALVQGVWTTDSTAIEAVTGPLVEARYVGDRPVVVRVRPDGSVLWQRDDVTPWSGEGFQTGTTGDTAIVAACPGGDPINCSGTILLGLDVATGATRWQRDDLGFAVDWGDGNALVGGPNGYEVITAATGQPLDATRWAVGTFAEECCGAGDYVHAERRDGLMVAVNGLQARVFYPAAVAGPTVTVSPF